MSEPIMAVRHLIERPIEETRTPSRVIIRDGKVIYSKVDDVIANLDEDHCEYVSIDTPRYYILPHGLSLLQRLQQSGAGSWQPISEMIDKYDGIFLIAAPELIDGDWNPEGVNIGWWQDDEGWRSTAWNGTQDFSYDIIVNPTHFRIIRGPYTVEERKSLEGTPQ